KKDEENFMAIVGSYDSSPLLGRETSSVDVDSSPTTKVDDLDVEVCSSEDEAQSIKDLQDAYNQLYEKCLQQKKKMLSLSTRLKTREDDKRTVHVDLVTPKVHICGLEEENKSLLHKLSFL
ncbi:unnamed protein product, partial [Ilex paraguariensis]